MNDVVLEWMAFHLLCNSFLWGDRVLSTVTATVTITTGTATTAATAAAISSVTHNTDFDSCLRFKQSA
jgi:hypothetical protein